MTKNTLALTPNYRYGRYDQMLIRTCGSLPISCQNRESPSDCGCLRNDSETTTILAPHFSRTRRAMLSGMVPSRLHPLINLFTLRKNSLF